MKYKIGDKVEIIAHDNYNTDIREALKKHKNIFTIKDFTREKSANGHEMFRIYKMEEIGYNWSEREIKEFAKIIEEVSDSIDNRFEIMDL